jgi:translation initiation factor IF-3
VVVTQLGLGGGKRDIVKSLRVNQGILAREVRLVGDKGEQLGIMPISQARETARKHNLDLVEVAPTAVPPVCRLLDYGKYKYEQAKKERELRKSQKVSLLREVRLRPKIDNHDFESKVRMVKKLLGEGDRVKVAVRFRGREITHPEIGWRLIQRMTESLAGLAAIVRQPVIEERNMNVILSPLADQKAKSEAKAGVKAQAKAEAKKEVKKEPEKGEK